MPSTRGTPSGRKSDLYDNTATRIRYQAYSRLQSTAVAFGESLPIPEIVAIGGQSDGKSSLMEAFLGFGFNVCSSEMGTRRPLIVQMVHDPAAKEPRCRLQDEEGTTYGDILPEGAIADAIRDRTETHLRRVGATVSPKPICMRTEYAFCPNLTVIDMPGLILKARNGDAESTPDDILKMVKEQCAPSHRLILFLQQSSVEWASSLWMHVIQEVDPSFSRTVMVASKFDNRLKEFSERWELETYLSAAGYLPQTVKPFFVALPKDKSHSNSAEWRSAIQKVDSSIKDHLSSDIEGGYDEERFGARIGFGNLKRFLEEELATRYRDAAPATLALLQRRCAAVAAELSAAESRVTGASDVAALRRGAIRHTLALASRVDDVMAGFGGADPGRCGMTTEEERAASGTAWPGLVSSQQPSPPNAGLRLFGGAAFERCLQEFRRAASAATFAPVPKDRVANMLLAQRSRGDGAGAGARAAEELARIAAREALGPLLDTACARLAAVVRTAYSIAADLEGSNPTAGDAMRPYVAFHTALRSAFEQVVTGLEEQARDLVQRQLSTSTGHFCASVLLDVAAMGSDNALSPSQGEFGSPLPHQVQGGGINNNSNGVEDLAGDRENEAPMPPPPSHAQERHHFATTQMTVPETPSPDTMSAAKAEMPLGRRVHLMSNAGRNVDAASPAKGRVSKAARLGAKGQGSIGTVGSGYDEVCAHAERLFSAIKQSVAGQAAPAMLKSAFLEPLQERLASELCVELVGKKDEEFMQQFTTSGALEALEEARDALFRRAEGLTRMKDEFGELANAL